MKKSALQLDMEIAAALVEARKRPSITAAKTDVLRVRLTRGLGSILSRSQLALHYAIKRTGTGYTFESSDAGVIRAFWKKLTDVYYRPPSGAGGRAIGHAAGKKLADLWPIVQASWPEALTE